MKSIWKWTLTTLTPKITIEMPKGATILAVQNQMNSPQLWALVDPSAPVESRTFKSYGTGHPVPDNPGVPIGTFQTHSGALVFHVFEEKK